MNRFSKITIGTGALVLAAASGLASAPSASASPQQSSDGSAAVSRQLLPAQPRAAVVAAATRAHPSISPSVTVTHAKSGAAYTCWKGTLCTTVYDPIRKDWAIFHLYACRTYSLSYWNGTGNWADRQTGGVRSYFYGSRGQTLKSFTSGTNVSQNWSPVYKIKNC